MVDGVIETNNIPTEALPANGSAVARTVRGLRRMSLSAAEGDYLGSEGDLLSALGVSRPTLRQAAKVLESERLVSVRRGVNGGFYAVRPRTEDVMRLPALWLRLNNATLAQMNAANLLFAPTAAARAAHCRDETLRRRMQDFHDAIDLRMERTETQSERVEQDSGFIGLIGEMAGDPVLRLFLDIGYVFGMLQQDTSIYRDSRDRQIEWLVLQRRLSAAILSGDPDLATLISQRRGELIAKWIESDTAHRKAIDGER